jgi:hypothetical protein
VHADDDERGSRSGRDELREPRHTPVAEDRLVDDRHGGRHALDQPQEIAGVSRRRERLDARLGLEQAPERGSQPLVTDRQEDGRRRRVAGCEARGHLDKHRPPAPAAHPGARLIQTP